MSNNRMMAPVSLMLDADRRRKLREASRSTRVSMSELVRISVDRLMSEIGDPRHPDAAAWSAILASVNLADEPPCDDRTRKPKSKA